jgi:hypothetical protein
MERVHKVRYKCEGFREFLVGPSDVTGAGCALSFSVAGHTRLQQRLIIIPTQRIEPILSSDGTADMSGIVMCVVSGIVICMLVCSDITHII